MDDISISLALLGVIFTVVAFFYSSVGLGGGSSYTALLAIFGAGTTTIPMVSLALNLFVTSIGSLVFLSQRHVRLRLIAPFLISSIPMSYLGGMLHLPKILFYLVLLVSLSLAAFRIYFFKETDSLDLDERSKFLLAVGSGGVLGLIAGICGIGGGVYLVPLILLLGLGTAKEAAACGAFFIWINSLAGLLARLQFNSIDFVPYMPLIIGVVAGGLIGSFLGAGYFVPRTMQKILGSVLLVAIVFLGQKIILTLT